METSGSQDGRALADRERIDDVVRRFFTAFTTHRGSRPPLDVLTELFVPGAIITKLSDGGAEISSLERFVEPRRALLTGGRLVDFEEHETRSRTEIFGSIAQRFCVYEKAGILDGKPFTGRGVKTIQLVRLDGQWRITALAWEDERGDLVAPARL